MQLCKKGHYPQNALLSACLGLLAASVLLIFLLTLAGLIYLKTVSLHAVLHPSQLPSIVDAVMTYLQSKTLWELIPVFQFDQLFGIANVSFWTCLALIVVSGKLVLSNRHRTRAFRQIAENAANAFWQTPFMCPGPVTNYTVMFTGPVINPQVVQNSHEKVELDRMAETLERLIDAIGRDSKLPEERKKDAQDLVRTITEEAKLPEDKRKPAVVRAVLGAIPVVISTAKSLMELWTEIQPHVISFFHH